MSETENPPAPMIEPTTKEPAHAPDFSTVVKESQERLAGENPAPPAASSSSTSKPGPGRPKKCPKHGKSIRECGCEISAEKKETAAQKIEPVMAEIDLSEHLRLPIQSLSRIPASKYQIPELTFNLEESRACAEALNGVINAFAPNLERMSPQSAAVLSAGLVFGSIGFTKFQIYASVMEERRRSNSKPADEIQNEIANTPKTLHAEAAFRRSGAQ